MVARLPFPSTLVPSEDRPLAEFESVEQLAAIVGRSTRTIERWIKSGVPVDSADEFAIRVHSHPAALWPTSDGLQSRPAWERHPVVQDELFEDDYSDLVPLRDRQVA